jgi:hypothetical protein
MAELTLIKSDLPAHIQALQQATPANEWGTGQTAGFPVISIKGSKFHIRRGDESKLVTTDDGETPSISMQVVIIKTHAGLAKTYFLDAYIEGSDSKPTCYSVDGVAPASDSEERQAKSCSTCPHNQWGSRITEAGGKAKLCSDVKRLAVASPNQINDPMLLRVPPSSLKKWNEYTTLLSKRGCSPAHVVTKVSFDPAVAYPSVNFDAVEFISDEMVPHLEAVMLDPVLDMITGSVEGSVDPDVAELPASKKKRPAPPPKKEKSAKEIKAAAAAVALAEAQAMVAAAEADDDDDETAPAPAPKKKKAAKKKAAPEPVEDADDDDLDFDNLEFDD